MNIQVKELHKMADPGDENFESSYLPSKDNKLIVKDVCKKKKNSNKNLRVKLDQQHEVLLLSDRSAGHARK